VPFFKTVRVVLTFVALAVATYAMARAPLPPMARKLGLSIFPLIWVRPRFILVELEHLF
jgi:hypothetical protein